MLKLPNARKSLSFRNNKDIAGRKTTGKMPGTRTVDYIRIGPNARIHNVHYCHKDLENWNRGIIKRVAHEVEYDLATCLDFYDFVQREIIPRFTPLDYIDPDTCFEEWMKISKYNTKRQERLRNLRQDFYNHKVNRNKIFYCKSFIKSEFYNDWKEPRIINSRDDIFKAMVGGLIVRVQDAVMKDHFIKHHTPIEVAHMMYDLASRHKFVYETDYSSFEGSFKKMDMLNVEFKLFEHMLQNYPLELSLIREAYTRFNVCKYWDGHKNVYAKFAGSRMSGDMWTSLSNGFMNMCMIEYMKYKFEQVNRVPVSLDYLVEGDDGFIATDVELDFELVKKLGFQLKCERKDNVNDLSFCGICMYKGVLVPDANRIMNKFGYVHDMDAIRWFGRGDRTLTKKMKNMIHSRALSLMAMARGMPVLQAIAQQQLQFGGRMDPKYLDWWEKETYDFSDAASMTALPVSMDMRKFFEWRFGWKVERQLEIEKELEKCHDVCYDIDFTSLLF